MPLLVPVGRAAEGNLLCCVRVAGERASRSEICCDFRHDAKSDAVMLLDVPDHPLQHQHPAALADTLGMHGQHKNAAL